MLVCECVRVTMCLSVVPVLSVSCVRVAVM
uniref:Uncharacterized protein n=1 Tax=Arundo donax TaxID=35708 RepID=A0A0A9BTT3_ARUDO